MVFANKEEELLLRVTVLESTVLPARPSAGATYPMTSRPTS